MVISQDYAFMTEVPYLSIPACDPYCKNSLGDYRGEINYNNSGTYYRLTSNQTTAALTTPNNSFYINLISAPQICVPGSGTSLAQDFGTVTPQPIVLDLEYSAFPVMISDFTGKIPVVGSMPVVGISMYNNT
jgi:hypothetical protein